MDLIVCRILRSCSPLDRSTDSRRDAVSKPRFVELRRFVTDELEMNDGYFRNGEEIVIIPWETPKIAELVEGYLENSEWLFVIGTGSCCG